MAKSDPEREARLAAALRDNLKRRKTQARAVEALTDTARPTDGEADLGLRDKS